MKKVSRIVREEMEKGGLAEDWIYGLRHVDRMLHNWEFLVRTCERIGPQMACLLQIAVYFHDVKRNDLGEYPDHAQAGAAFFRAQRLEGLTEEERGCVAFAIANHNVGLEKLGLQPDCKRHVLLQLLCLLDGMDSLCYIGFFRVLGWYGQSPASFDLLGSRSAERLTELLSGEPANRELDALQLKDRAEVLPHLIYYLKVFERTIAPVANLLSEEFLEEVERRKTKLRSEIEKMIKLKAKNEKPLRFFPD